MSKIKTFSSLKEFYQRSLPETSTAPLYGALVNEILGFKKLDGTSMSTPTLDVTQDKPEPLANNEKASGADESEPRATSNVAGDTEKDAIHTESRTTTKDLDHSDIRGKEDAQSDFLPDYQLDVFAGAPQYRALEAEAKKEQKTDSAALTASLEDEDTILKGGLGTAAKIATLLAICIAIFVVLKEFGLLQKAAGKLERILPGPLSDFMTWLANRDSLFHKSHGDQPYIVVDGKVIKGEVVKTSMRHLEQLSYGGAVMKVQDYDYYLHPIIKLKGSTHSFVLIAKRSIVLHDGKVGYEYLMFDPENGFVNAYAVTGDS